MKNLPINWYQGLFVRPHHLQAAERYWTELGQTSQRLDHPYNYGLHTFSYSKDALESGRFRVTELEARMRDGSLIRLEHGEELEVDLKAAFERAAAENTETSFTIFLAVPKLNLGAENVSDPQSNGMVRYLRSTQITKDENAQCGDESIEFRKLQVRLLVGDEEVGYELLPVACVKTAGAREPNPILDEIYIPPLLAITAWPYLKQQFVQGIRDVIGGNIDRLSEPVRQLRVGRQSLEPADSGRVSMLDRLNEAYSFLDLMAPALGVHPFLAYSELVRILSRLSIFAPERRAVEFYPYDHDNLGPIFADIRAKILRIIQSVQFDEYLQMNFEGQGDIMQVRLGPEWFDPDWQWYLGVERGGLSESELHDMLEQSSAWYWVFGSVNEVEEYFHVRQSGLQRELMTESIHDLPPRRYWTYYKVAQDERLSPGWFDVRRTQTLAMRVRNYEDLTGARELDIVTPDGRQVKLRFALFAVRR